MKNRKKYILISGILFSVFIILFGVSYAFFNYEKETNEIISKNGDVYMRMTNSEEVIIKNAFPDTQEHADYLDDNFITFSVITSNTSNYPIYYDISTIYGSVISGYTEDDRFNDKDIMIELTDLKTKKVVVLDKFENLNDNKIYTKRVDPTGGVEVSDNYMLRIWIDEDTLISDTDSNMDYCASSKECNDSTKKIFSELFASIKLKVYGDLDEN